MFEHRRIKAFILSLVLCASAVQSFSAAAEDTTAAEDNAVYTQDEAAPAAETEGLITSGDFSYSLTHDNTVCIEECTSTDTDLVIPDTIDGIAVTELGKKAFGGLDDSGNPYSPYVSITLPASINYISADNPFVYCEKLEEIKFSGDCADFRADDGVLYSSDGKTIIEYPQAKSGSSFTIPEGVETIATAAIYNTQLSEIAFPSTLTTTQRNCCCYNANVKKIDISGTKLTLIADMAFASCDMLSEVLLPDALTEIGLAAFMNDTSLTEITLPEGLLTVRQSAFSNTGLSEITIPDSVTTIEYYAFGYKMNENNEEIADANFTVIGSAGSAAATYASGEADDNGNTNDFTFLTPDQNDEQKELLALDTKTSGSFVYAVVDGNAVITACNDVSSTVDIPETLDGYTVTMIYPTAFSSCMAEQINLPSTITTIRELSFYKCPNLKSIVLPEGIKEVSNNSFEDCTALESIDFGGAEIIGQSVVDGCTALKTVKMSGSCTSFNKDSEEGAFTDCTALESITVSEGSGCISSEDGVLYNGDKTVLLAYPAAKKGSKFKAPKTVKEISFSAFRGAKNLKNVNISKVQTIRAYAFMDCKALETAKLSRDLKFIGTDAFTNCDKLTSLRFYDKLETIGGYAFGFDYDANIDTSTGASKENVIEGFKVYADKDSPAYTYCKNMGVKCVTGTVYVLGLNVPTALLITLGVIVLIALAYLIIGKIAKSSKKKNKSRKDTEDKPAEKKADEKNEETENDEDENGDN